MPTDLLPDRRGPETRADLRSPVKRGLSGGLFLAVWLTLPAQARAQPVVSGRVVDDAELAPLAGALVSVFDPSGRRVGSVLADERGAFGFRLPEPGTWVVRAEMIGRSSVDALVGPGVTVPEPLLLRLPPHPVTLDGIDVNVGRRCTMVASAGPAIHHVWTEAQKALRAASVTAAEALYRFRIAVYERVRDSRSDEILRESSEQREVTGYDPFASLSPDTVHQRGYVAEREGQTWIYGPSLEVLLSGAFVSDHCFGLRRNPAAGLVGVTFESADGRRVPEIEGVLWLDQATAELRALEYRFLRLPWYAPNQVYRGFTSFRRLDAGRWTIDRWWLRWSAVGGARFLEEAGEVLTVTRLPQDEAGR